MTRVISVDPDNPDPGVIAEAARILQTGGLVAFATETVYGLGADATNPMAVARIFAAKGRPSTNPLIVHVHSTEAAHACVREWSDRAESLANRFWPGPLTLVLPRSAMISDLVTAGQATVGVRVPRPFSAQSLIQQAGRPIAAPSANRSNRISPTSAAHVLLDLEGRIDLILDSGPTTIGIESTVLDLSTEIAQVLRPGQITLEEIAQALNKLVVGRHERLVPNEAARSPGQLASHYAPRTPSYRLEREQLVVLDQIEGRFGSLSIGDQDVPGGSTSLILPDDPVEVAARLYAALHALDALGLDFLVVIPPPDEPAWRAVRDRIWRATSPIKPPVGRSDGANGRRSMI